MKATLVPLLVTAGLLGGCAASPQREQEVVEQAQPIADEHLRCMLEKSRSLEAGADDTEYLVRTADGLCKPLLVALEDRLDQEGLSDAFVHAYVGAVARQHRAVTAEGVMLRRSEGASVR